MLKVLAPLAAAALLSLISACTTTDIAPADPHLNGQWRLDPAASDDADARIATAVAEAESKLRKRLVNAGFSQYGNNHGTGRGGRGGGSTSSSGSGSSGTGSSDGSGSSGELNGDEFSATGYIGPDFEDLRRELQRALEAPRQLTIDIQQDTARIASESSPARDYSFGDTFTRIDEYGTARVDSEWSGQTLVLRSRYSSHAELIEHYLGDARAATLTVTRNLTDPIAGKLTVRAVYRR